MLRLNRILVPRDFSQGSHQALVYALDLAHRSGAEVHTLYAEVIHGEPFGPSSEPTEATKERLRDRLETRAAEELEGERYDFESGSLQIKHEVVRDIAAAPAILNYVEQQDIDLVVMGTHGRRGVRRLFLGSVSEEVVRLSPCPVLTVREQEVLPERVAFASILVPADFSEHARGALRHAKELAAVYGARLELLHVIEETLHPAFYYNAGITSIYDVEPDIEEKAVEHLQCLSEEAGGPDVEVSVKAMPGRAARKIVQHAEDQDTDLIVMATHGRTGLAHFSLGSVAEKVVRTAPCPVFTVKSFGKSLLETPSQEEAEQRDE